MRIQQHTNKRKTSLFRQVSALSLPLKYQSAVLLSILVPLYKEICVSIPQIKNMRSFPDRKDQKAAPQVTGPKGVKVGMVVRKPRERKKNL